jgi:agmatinase
MTIRTLQSGEGFLGLTEPKDMAYEYSGVVIQQIPYEQTSSFIKGSKMGPEKILACSPYLEFYDEETDSESCFKTGICTLESMPLGEKVYKEAVDAITSESLKLLKDGKFLISLGAEHTVTYGLFKAHQEMYPNCGILQLDAHSDLRMTYEGTPWSHACVMARIHELNQPEIIQLGIRAQCKEEAALIRESQNIHTYYDHQISGQLDDYIEEIIELLPEHVYITIDADGFDPGIIPAIGTAEPGGLQWHDTLRLLQAVCTEKKVIGFDVVELAPKEDSVLSEYSLAKLVYKMHNYLCLNPWFMTKFGKHE